MKSKFLRIATTAMGLTFAIGTLAACGGGDDTTGGGYDNETKSLVLSTDLPDGVFNPFFYTAGADGDIVGQTMVGMLSTDEKGQIIAGEEEPCVALDYSVVTTGSRADMTGGDDDYSHYYTDYYIAVKDNITFSDGTPLTIKDVLFNIYMYLDPAYTGSSTMYSVDIQGLQAYRTQTEDVNQQQQFEGILDQGIQTRVDAILDWADNNREGDLNALSEDSRADLDKIDELFRDELSTDWNTAMAADLKEYEKYVDVNGTKLITENWQVFLYNYRVYDLDLKRDAQGNKYYEVMNELPSNITDHTKDSLVNYVFSFMLGSKSSATKTYKQNVSQVISIYATANTFRQYLRGVALTALLDQMGGMRIKTVSGIDTYRASTIPAKEGTKELGKELDILHIRINGEDPKAIQNFGFTVAPMHYYSSEASKYDGTTNFGVKYGDSEFMDSVRAIQVPMGAGPYRATSEGGTDAKDIANLSKSDFFRDNVVYMERNDTFFLGAPKIKKLRFTVVNNSLLYQSVKRGEIDYGSPTATNEMITRLDGEDHDALDYTITDNLGYGYIGINASYVHSLLIRKAIMYAMDTSLCIDYYGSGTLASAIYRPMSKVLSDYYPTNVPAYYPYDKTGQKSLQLANRAGYTMDTSSGLLKNAAGDTLKFTFTIAGDSEDHPAFSCMNNAAALLNSIGFDITVTRDSTALSKLAAGRLEVWAAAWSSSSDPDMYQVYHKNSSASSILAWGYPWLKSVDSTQDERDILDELAVRIEEGRETTVVSERKAKYSVSAGPKLDDGGSLENLCALDLVMELAVELPTYQRKALFVYRRGLFDDESIALFAESTAFQSPLNKIWKIGFKA